MNHDRFYIDKYKEKIKAGESIVPIFVSKDDHTDIVDGNHRAQAYRELGIPTPTVTVDREHYRNWIRHDFDRTRTLIRDIKTYYETEVKDKTVILQHGGPGSGWHAEEGHVPGSHGGGGPGSGVSSETGEGAFHAVTTPTLKGEMTAWIRTRLSGNHYTYEVRVTGPRNKIFYRTKWTDDRVAKAHIDKIAAFLQGGGNPDGIPGMDEKDQNIAFSNPHWHDTYKSIQHGGPGSGWTAEDGHVPGSQGGSGEDESTKEWEKKYDEGVDDIVKRLGVSPRAERAIRTKKPMTLAKRTLATDMEEKVRNAIGGIRGKDSSEYDVIKGKYMIEVKTLIEGENDKLTVHPSSRKLKEKFVKSKKMKGFMVGIDARKPGVSREGTAPGKIYVREGFGAYRLHTMKEVTIEELQEMFK